MKKIDIVFISICSLLTIHFHAEHNKSEFFLKSYTEFNSEYFYSKKTSIEESTFFIKKNALLIVAIPSMIYFHKNIIATINKRPYVSAICFYALINYVCDAVLDYQRQQALLDTILLIKKIALYLVISHGVKNHIHFKKQLLDFETDEQNFFENITHDLPYSFNEITLITLKSYQELKAILQKINISINVESEEFVFLCHAASINVHSILYLTQNDKALHQMIANFEQNPKSNLHPLLQHLGLEITTTFLKLEKNLTNIQKNFLTKK